MTTNKQTLRHAIYFAVFVQFQRKMSLLGLWGLRFKLTKDNYVLWYNSNMNRPGFTYSSSVGAIEMHIK